MRAQLLEMLEQQEGYRQFVYHDEFGNATIGYGFNLNVGISKNAAIALLAAQANELEVKLQHIPWFNYLVPARKDCIIDMCFNIGIDGMLGFHDMIAAIQDNDYSRASAAMLNSQWAKQVGQRAIVLSDMMQTGQYPIQP